MAKSFTVIIPTLNEQSHIGHLLSDIHNQSILPKQVIVTDGFSTDNTCKIVQQFKNIILLKSPPHLASQRNAAAKLATGHLLFFLDADTRLPPDFFQTSLKKLGGAKICCPFYLPYNSILFIYLTYLFFNLMFFLFQKTSASGAGSCIIVSRSVFQKIGGFNIHVKFEDIEFIRRTSKKFPFKMIPQVIWVSDRRFRKYGFLKTTLQYLLLSFLFLFDQFNYSPVFPYKFGKYNS
jgi:glycosyltransferase involved in cell wall biosynthesis